MNTPLEVLEIMLSLAGDLAKVGLFAGVPIIVDGIFKELSGEHIIPVILAAFAWVNINSFRPIVNYFRPERPYFYRGTRRMSMSVERAKTRIQREIDAVYDEAWFHNIVEDLNKGGNDILGAPKSWASKVDWNWA